MTAPLRAYVHVAEGIPSLKADGTQAGVWSPIASTLICGPTEAVLVDTPITFAQNDALADWIEAQLDSRGAGVLSPRLTYIYITHGHPDHWLGIGALQKRFPGLKAVATRGTVEQMKHDGRGDAYAQNWITRFPKQVDDVPAIAEALPETNQFFVDGNVCRAIPVGHTDGPDSTVLWVPSIKLVAGGDVLYGDVHQTLLAANTKALREEWIRALETVQALQPDIVVPAHKKVHELTGASHLENTKKYLEDAGAVIETGQAHDPATFQKIMTEKYPSRIGQSALFISSLFQKYA
ncbi:hypothetical protein M409DRAFT_59807 [Zasmidium cellare ATCC 36951]|uniref:Metallo-beta-lactamase domain-containing protein n=1 Tax=Zasmidium cellare ATCC 36951 TaxID=1080233 RepID=A0A6A6C2M6_ZASCE|nr:uncharacterized protein M409DRAFT_59807 [Zasmidium cellare ATCC 36951]KAF2160538.1 hypothetical protein M409DRAFT_59807 [Zasmidium cellare ATCC 36951]